VPSVVMASNPRTGLPLSRTYLTSTTSVHVTLQILGLSDAKGGIRRATGNLETDT
jgi:hypothetical protein